MKKRETFQVMSEILGFCRRPRLKTHIMYRAKLSYEQLQAYLGLLKSHNLLTNNSERYVTTKKGLEFLEAFVQLRDVLKEGFVEIVETYYEEVQVVVQGEKVNVSEVLG